MALPAADDPVATLLHLAGLAVIIAIGYIGLDRVRRDPDRFWEDLIAAQRTAEEILRTRLDIERAEGTLKLSSLLDVYPVYILCYIAKIDLKMKPYWRLCHFVHRQLYVPFLGYFRTRTDKYVVSALCFICLVIFLCLSATAIWDVTWVRNPLILKAAWLTLSSSILWVCGTVPFSYPLDRIKLAGVCEKLTQRTEARVERLQQDIASVVEKTRKRLEARSSGTG